MRSGCALHQRCGGGAALGGCFRGPTMALSAGHFWPDGVLKLSYGSARICFSAHNNVNGVTGTPCSLGVEDAQQHSEECCRERCLL